MTLEARLRRALDAKAKPVGALGRLEDLAVQLGLLQQTDRPVVRDPVVLVFAADHGATASGISSYPSSVTGVMVRAYLEGRAAVNVLASLAGARVLVVDAGVATDLAAHPGLRNASIRRGTSDWSHGLAMSEAEAQTAIRAGEVIGAELADGGSTVLALGEMGIGTTASAVLLAHKLAGVPLRAGPGAGQDAAGLAWKQAVMESASARTAPRLGPVAALSAFGGFEIAMLAGAILGAASRGVCLVIDGAIVTAAVLVAQALQPSCLDACVFAHRSAEPAHNAMLEFLDRQPLFDLGMRLGEGTGAALAIPLLRASSALLTDMAKLADLA